MFVRVEPTHVTDAPIGLSRTPARLNFKSNAGQNNHFLITVLVGLDCVREGRAKLNEEFSTSWSPKDVERSAARSRTYVLTTSLAWIADLTDVYRKQLQRMRSVISDQKSSELDKLDGSAKRLEGLATTLSVRHDDLDLLLTMLAIKWRNTSVHSGAAPRIDSTLKSRLLTQYDAIEKQYSGLDVARSIESFKKGSPPSFKEVASFIAAAQNIVESLDVRAIMKIDVELYAETVILTHFSSPSTDRAIAFPQFWPGSSSKTRKRLTTLLLQNGFSPNESLIELDPGYLDSLSDLSARAARDRFSSDSQA